MEAQIEAATSSALLFLYGSKPIDRLPGQEAAWATATPRCHPAPVRGTRRSTRPAVDMQLRFDQNSNFAYTSHRLDA